MTAPQHCCRCQPRPAAERRSCAIPDDMRTLASSVEPGPASGGSGGSVPPYSQGLSRLVAIGRSCASRACSRIGRCPGRRAPRSNAPAVDVSRGSDEGRTGPHSHDLTDVLAQPWICRGGDRARDRACRRGAECDAHDREVRPEKQPGAHSTRSTMPLMTRKRPTIASAPTASLEAFSRSQTLKRAVACAVQAGATR